MRTGSSTDTPSMLRHAVNEALEILRVLHLGHLDVGAGQFGGVRLGLLKVGPLCFQCLFRLRSLFESGRFLVRHGTAVALAGGALGLAYEGFGDIGVVIVEPKGVINLFKLLDDASFAPSTPHVQGISQVEPLHLVQVVHGGNIEIAFAAHIYTRVVGGIVFRQDESIYGELALGAG